MAKIHSSTLPNGLPLYRVDLPGTRAVTVLVAFEAGARTERTEENGMAHFLEHLVFKGGEKFSDYKQVNETAERMGAMLNAYTSHDLVAFHITCRAEVVGEAIDLLTDFVGRPKVDAEELDRERGVVIQEIARANDQPSMVAEHLIDRAAFGDHPLGRPVLGPEEHLRTFTRDAILAFRRRQWAGGRGGAFLVGNLAHVPENQELVETFGRFPSIQSNGALRAGARAGSGDAGRGPRVQPVAPADLLPPGDRPARRARAGGADRLRHAARAARWARACSTRSASGAASRTPSTRSTTRSPTCRSCSCRRGSTPPSASRPTAACAGSSTSCARTARREEEVERARAYAAGRRVLAFENTNAVARHAAAQTVVHGQEIDPDVAIAALDEVSFAEVADVAAGISEAASVACVGPHERRFDFAARVKRRFAVLRWRAR